MHEQASDPTITMAKTRVASTDNATSTLLVEAIERSLGVETAEQFGAWLSESLAALLAYEIALHAAIGKDGEIALSCVAKVPLAQDTLRMLCEPEHSPGLRWAQTCRPSTSMALDAQRLRALCVPETRAALDFVRSAIAHRIRLPAGEECALILLNVEEQSLERGLYLLTLLSPQLQAMQQRIADRRQRCVCAELTPREREILRLMAVSQSNREISARLAINPITLKHHVTKIYRKLDVHSRIEAVARLQQQDCTANCRTTNR